MFLIRGRRHKSKMAVKGHCEVVFCMHGKGAYANDIGGLQGTPQGIQKKSCANAPSLPFTTYGKPRQNKERDWVLWRAFGDPCGRFGVLHFARRRGISPEMAIRLSVAFGGSAESWIAQQAQYDLWRAMQGVDGIKRQVQAFA